MLGVDLFETLFRLMHRADHVLYVELAQSRLHSNFHPKHCASRFSDVGAGLVFWVLYQRIGNVRWLPIFGKLPPLRRKQKFKSFCAAYDPLGWRFGW